MQTPCNTIDPRRLGRLAAVVAAVALSGGAASARGSDELEVRSDWLAAPDVRALVAEDVGGRTHRAVVLVEHGRPALVLEVVGVPHGRRVVAQVQHELAVLPLASIAQRIDGLELSGGRLAFQVAVEGAVAPLRCTLDVRGAALPSCRGHLPAARGAWSEAPEVARACDEAFYGAASRRACRERVRAFAVHPVATIEACDTHAYGDEGALQCLAIAGSYTLEPRPVVAACDAATYGQESFVDCLRHAAAFRADPVAHIQACDVAMLGDQATIACLGYAARYPGDATATIRVCDGAMVGDEATLACVRRGGAY